MMAAGLIRIVEVANRISAGTADRGVAHATSGHCLQQNLVCVLEGELMGAERVAVVGVGQTQPRRRPGVTSPSPASSGRRPCGRWPTPT